MRNPCRINDVPPLVSTYKNTSDKIAQDTVTTKLSEMHAQRLTNSGGGAWRRRGGGESTDERRDEGTSGRVDEWTKGRMEFPRDYVKAIDKYTSRQVDK